MLHLNNLFCNNQWQPVQTFWKQSGVFTLVNRIKRASEVTALDACEESQIEASRDLDGLQSHRGGCEEEGDGKDLLGIHHQSGWLPFVFQNVLN